MFVMAFSSNWIQGSVFGTIRIKLRSRKPVHSHSLIQKGVTGI